MRRPIIKQRIIKQHMITIHFRIQQIRLPHMDRPLRLPSMDRVASDRAERTAREAAIVLMKDDFMAAHKVPTSYWGVMKS